MNEAEEKVKQQIVEKINTSNNILVTVSRDPTVDDLSAAIGLTAFLNKIGKHVTAIFSGLLPPAITFLEPDKVFENNADSLRDFIIALDKEKADHLRYKVEGDVVKIFITPYRTNITSDDLEFSQGEYNVDLVLALGVSNQDHLDTALAAQGQILHDVTIATFSAGDTGSQLGSIDWRDENASSLSEMVAIISDSIETDQDVIDKQISTALLTGIVSATDRFSNVLTSSRVMSIAAQLMAAGADQQLIATQLQDSHEINSLPSISKTDEVDENHLSIQHGTDSDKDIPTVQEILANLKQPEAPEEPEPPLSTLSPEIISDAIAPTSESEQAEEPLLGGILNATSDQAAEDARRELEDQQNKTILTHSYVGGSDNNQTATVINSANQTEDGQNVDIFADTPPPLPPPPPVSDYSTLPPEYTMPDANSLPSESPLTSTLPPQQPVNDPTQFQIPTQ